MRRSFKTSLIAACMLLAPALVLAQPSEWPSKLVKIVVNWSAGGQVDILARTAGEKMAHAFNQPFIIENKPGAGGLIGASQVAHAPADGYTLLFTIDNPLTITPNLMKAMPFDPLKDLKPIALFGETAMVLVVNPKLGVKSVADFVQLAKKKNLFYPSAGVGSAGQMANEKFSLATGIKMTHVPHQGNTAAVQAMIVGDVQGGLLGVSASMLQNIKAGKLVALAVSSLERLPELPEVPTLNESGYKGFQILYSMYMLAPAQTPDAVAKKIYEQLRAMASDADVKKRFEMMSIELKVGDGEMARKRIAADLATWHQVAKQAKVEME